MPRFGALHLEDLGRIYIKLKIVSFYSFNFQRKKINFAIKTYLWGLLVQSNSPFSCPNMLRGICFCLFCCGRLYQKKAKTSEKLKMAVFFASVVPSPLTNRFSSSTLDQSLIYHYPHCPVHIFGRHFEKKSPHSDKPLKGWFGPAVYNIRKVITIQCYKKISWETNIKYPAGRIS